MAPPHEDTMEDTRGYYYHEYLLFDRDNVQHILGKEFKLNTDWHHAHEVAEGESC